MSPAVALLAGQPVGTKAADMVVVVVVVAAVSVVVVVVVAADSVAANGRCTRQSAPNAVSTPRYPSCPGVTNLCTAATASVR